MNESYYMEVTKKSYSSSANLGPGYDILSLGHKAFFDSVTVKHNNSNGVKIISNSTPEEPDKNTAGLSILKIMEDKGIKTGLDITIKKGVPIGLGLGSSGASSSAAVRSVNELLDLGMGKDEMVYYSMYGEIAACGSAHPDNVSSGIYGGLTLISSTSPVKVKKIDINCDFNLVLVIPDISMKNKTRYARSIVPQSIKMEEHIVHTSRISTMLYGFMKGDRDAIREGMNDDIVERSREAMFPFYRDIKEKVINRNAVSACISGAGPTMLIFTDDKTRKDEMLGDIKNVMGSYNTDYSIRETGILEGLDDQ
ncbi:homoserine kinase [Ferroplasma acidiphilum]|uniref:homoserine kinase n=2 Tax=Ferroplasma acidiphilum TaxID=74969 RepID=UPI0023F57C6D|nr:homoserine kinase [Ferroplasma acidiphilum]